MRPLDTLAIKLRALMVARPDMGTLPKVTAACGVSNGTLDRIRRAAVSTPVDEREHLGRAFGVEPWELLRPHGHANLSPLAMLLAVHLDRSAQDPDTHTAAYVAGSAVIQALTITADSPPEPGPAPGSTPGPLRATKKERAE